MLPKEEEALRPYVFHFNNCFVSAGFVADARENLAQMSSQIEMEEEDFMENFNPWIRDVQLVERMLDSQDSMQKETNMKEGKDEMVVDRIRQLQWEDNEQKFEELVNNNNNLRQRERGSSKWQSMD